MTFIKFQRNISTENARNIFGGLIWFRLCLNVTQKSTKLWVVWEKSQNIVLWILLHSHNLRYESLAERNRRGGVMASLITDDKGSEHDAILMTQSRKFIIRLGKNAPIQKCMYDSSVMCNLK